MAPASIQLTCDPSPLAACLSKLREFASLEGFREFFELTFGLEDVAPKLVCAKSQPAAEGTITVTLEPSDRLLDFLAAVRAGDLQRHLVQ